MAQSSAFPRVIRHSPAGARGRRIRPALVAMLLLFAGGRLDAQGVLDDFNRAQANDLAGSGRWRRLLDLTDTSATMQINADSTVSPHHPLGTPFRGGVYWDSALGGRFEVGIVLRHKSGGNNLPVFHLHLMNDSSWFTGDGYGLRFQENSGTDRYDIQRLTGSGTDTPVVSLLATRVQELAVGDTLVFKSYEGGRRVAVRYAASGTRDSISTVDTVHHPGSWYAWIQARVFPDPVKLDDFFIRPLPYRISASAGPGGSISPAGDALVQAGASLNFTVTPDPGFGIAGVLVDSVPVGTPTSYEFQAVSADHTIEALFDTLTWTVTPWASAHGAIAPAGPVSGGYWDTLSFAIDPDPGCHLDSLLVDGIPVDSTTSYTFSGLTADRTIAAYFSVDAYTIDASAGPFGSITPSGPVTVASGTDQAFTIAPSTGAHVDSVVVDGSPVDSTAGYTFHAVTADHSISAHFSMNVYTITAGAGPNGSIVPSGAVPVTHGSSASFTVTPDSGWYVDTIRVDGLPVDSTAGYTFTNVTAPRAIFVTFTDRVELTLSSPVGERWNIVSVPLHVADFAATLLYPGASGPAYSYTGGYAASETLEVGRGYWMKFPAADSVTMTGLTTNAETLDVDEGWNMVGSISTAIPAADVASIPPGLAGSGFYGYSGGYAPSAVIEPGRGYWIKMSAAGKLVLAAGGPVNRSATLRTTPYPAELPPPPPGGADDVAPGSLPPAPTVSQNFPNPFNPVTTIEFTLPRPAEVRLTVYNVLGEEVARLLETARSAGTHRVRFDASGLPAGFYVCRLVVEGGTSQLRMLLLK